MSLASAIIQDAYDAIGRGSEILTTDASLTNRALLDLQSIMEELRKNGVVLEETVSGVTTTIALPTATTDELDEPVAARMHLVNILAVYSATHSRVDLSGQSLPTIPQSEARLDRMYKVHTIPSKVPSSLAPKGQGSRYGRNSATFFDGTALDDDLTST